MLSASVANHRQILADRCSVWRNFRSATSSSCVLWKERLLEILQVSTLIIEYGAYLLNYSVFVGKGFWHVIGTSSANCPLWSVYLQPRKQDLPNAVDPGDSITQGASDQSMGFGMAAELQAGQYSRFFWLNNCSLARLSEGVDNVR